MRFSFLSPAHQYYEIKFKIGGLLNVNIFQIGRSLPACFPHYKFFSENQTL